MENRRKYFLRGPVEIQLSALATGIETLSDGVHEPCKITCKVISQKIRETITEIIREDKKSENPFVKIGDEVMFGVNAKGTIKIIPKGQENTPFTPNNKPYVKDTSRDDVIMIQTMLKSSAEYHGKRKDSTINDVMDTAQIWYEFSKSVVSQKPVPAPKPVVIERTKVNDNPF